MPDLLDRLKTALANRYAIEREIGAGGMATVYLAHDLKHERQVAVKVLRPELAAVVGAERFLQEIQIAAKLNHPHILTLIDSGEAGGFLYYVMPYVQGESLRDKLTREKQLGIDEAVRITKTVANVLTYAHSQGVIHRDIKPENILLHEGEAIVADFGIALALSAAGGERLTQSGLSPGTPHYMSPEQAMAVHQPDARSDIYSLGAVLYEMLAGEPPHTGHSGQAIIAKLLTEKPTPLRILRDTVPDALDQVVMKALAKVPADRFATAAEFAAAVMAAGMRVASHLRFDLHTPTTPSAAEGDAPVAASQAGLVTNVELADVKTFDPRVAAVMDRAVTASARRRAAFVGAAAVAGLGTVAVGVGLFVSYTGTTFQAAPTADPGPAAVAADTTAIVVPTTPASGQEPTADTSGPSALVDSVFPEEPLTVDEAIEFIQDSTPTVAAPVEPIPMTEVAPSQCDDFNPDTYNLNNECFDEQPRPLQATIVPLTAQIQGRPTPVILAIKVNPDGSVAQVLQIRGSDNQQFTILTIQFARGIQYNPAQKSGRPIAGWTQLLFHPGARQ